MKRVFISLTTKGSIDKAVEKLQAYKKELADKSDEFAEALLSIGIESAKANTGKYAGYIQFSKSFEHTEDGCTGILMATNGARMVVEWYTDKARHNKRSYEVSPILLAEFGSGWLANVLWDVPGVGQGTMPNSYGHAADPDGWYWYDISGTKHHSIGEPPLYPMHSAAISMMVEIERIAREVWRN